MHHSNYDMSFKVMSDDPDLDPEICKQFFEDNVFKLDASKLNEHGLRWVFVSFVFAVLIRM